MILITGGAGYIGSHVLAAMYDQDAQTEIVVLDDCEEGNPSSVERKGTFLIKGNTGDRPLLNKIFSQFPIHTVVHLAARAYTEESEREPLRYFQNNVSSSIALFDAMEEHGVRSLLYSSSCTVYGELKSVPADEHHPLQPTNVYGQTKLMVETIVKSLHRTRQWSYIILRYFNAAGAHVNGRIGESHRPETHLIPRILKSARDEIDAIEIYGNDYDTADGTCIRDYVHVSDLAVAHRTAVNLLLEGPRASVFNLGTQNGYSVRQVVDMCSEVTGKDIRINWKPRRIGDAAMSIADASAAARELDWKPQHDLRSIIETAWHWECNRRY
jgi:UDP-glucose 4-epimerase